MSVNWETVQTNVVTAIIIGSLGVAGAIIWNGATTVDQKVNEAQELQVAHTEALQSQTDYMQKAVKALEKEARDSKQRDQEIIRALNELRDKKDDKVIEEPVIPEEDYIQKTLPRIDVRQMPSLIHPREIPNRPNR